MKEKNVTHTAARGSVLKSDVLESARGPVAIPMTNDYLFRAMLQRNNKVLKGLLCSLLHLAPEQIRSAVITNPIELGAAIDSKTFFLDIRLILNDSAVVNLEMQVVNEHNWPERSLSYLCRTFDQLNAGDGYHRAKPVVQIGLLDFTLFPERPEFCSTYRLLNMKNHAEYSDKLTLSVVDLTRTDLATEEDRSHRADYWAGLFKSTTWEEIKMLAQKDEYIREASDTVYELSQEELIRLQCEAREDYYRRQRDVEEYVREREEAIREQDAIIEKQSATIQDQSATIQDQKERLSEKDAEIARLRALLGQNE